jgi:hypothetical protein
MSAATMVRGSKCRYTYREVGMTTSSCFRRVGGSALVIAATLLLGAAVLAGCGARTTSHNAGFGTGIGTTRRVAVTSTTLGIPCVSQAVPQPGCPLATTTTTTLVPTGPFPGPTSDGVEYICYDGTGSGGNGGAVIAAANVEGSCPSSQFPYQGQIQIGWGFVCVYPPSPVGPGAQAPYPASIGSFTQSGVIGTFNGAYCPRSSASSLTTAPASG